MNETTYQFLSLDLPPLLTATFSALACALLGNFLVLRRLSMMGDAISHAVLPGIVVAFLVSGSRATFTVFAGAALAGILAAMLIELVRKFGRLESGAAMGVVFSILFAAGVLLMEQAAARNVDLDADCLLHGQLETIFWYPPRTLPAFFTAATYAALPSQVVTSLLVLVLSALFVKIFFKELALSSFDPALSTSLGFNAGFLHQLLMIFVAGAVVASFEAVGSILVIAMIICPAATARFYTDRLRTQIALSLVFAAISAAGGYVLGAFGPLWLGYTHSVNAAGMMTVAAGALLFGSAIFAPRYGVVSRQVRRVILSLQVYRDDIRAFLFRAEELTKKNDSVTAEEAFRAVGGGTLAAYALRQLQRAKDVTARGLQLTLTEQGRTKARTLVRSHRLWESFLVEKAGLAPDHVHGSAEQLEHFTQEELRKRLAEAQEFPAKDPHGREIP